MKKLPKILSFFFILCTAFVAFLTASSVHVHATDATVSLAVSDGVLTPASGDDAAYATWTSDCLTIVQTQGTSSSEVLLSNDEARWYKSHVVSFTPAANITITSMVFTCIKNGTNNTSSGLGTGTWSKGTATNSGATATWTGSATSEFTVTLSSQSRPGSIAVTYVTTVPTTGVTLDKTSESIEVGETTTLTQTVAPDSATNKVVIWSSSDEAVATVENGVVTAVAEGTATISCISDYDNTIKATATITVTAPSDTNLYELKSVTPVSQLSFSYSVTKPSVVTTPVAETEYYLGSVECSGVSTVNTVTSATLSADATQGEKFTVIYADATYFYIVSKTNTKYLGYSGSKTSLTITEAATATADTTGKYLWYMSDGIIVSKLNTTRCLAFNGTDYTQVKAYQTTSSTSTYPRASFLTTTISGSVSDAEATADSATIRFGFTISKTVYADLSTRTNFTGFGVYLSFTKDAVAKTSYVNIESSNFVESGDDYLVFVAINGVGKNYFDVEFTAQAYVTIDGTTTLSDNSAVYSVKTLADEYITNYSSEEAVVNAIDGLCYLAYYA